MLTIITGHAAARTGTAVIGHRLFSLLDAMSSVLGWLWRVHDVPKLFYSPAVASVTVRAGYTDGSAGSEATKEQEKVSLRDLVERRCPSLHNTFVPAWWLPK